MLRLTILASLGLIACRFDGPDLGGKKFQCDDNHPCPGAELCVNNVCGGNLTDGAPDSADGVMCGAAGTCAVGMKCCNDFVGGGLRCIAGDVACNGESISCDGIEDCMTGQACCDSGCGDPASCNMMVCVTDQDCIGQFGRCCDLGRPWKQCSVC